MMWSSVGLSSKEELVCGEVFLKTDFNCGCPITEGQVQEALNKKAAVQMLVVLADHSELEPSFIYKDHHSEIDTFLPHSASDQLYQKRERGTPKVKLCAIDMLVYLLLMMCPRFSLGDIFLSQRACRLQATSLRYLIDCFGF